ncbi:MAG: InlB B-repeat-containing protein, partial [Clostridia bacterium]|nr:InlB B-repeat-containing protein [Clostridia bacterium]
MTKGTGIASVTGAATYYYGASVTINATVTSGYTWVNWTGYNTQTTKNYTFTMPAQAVSYKANAADKTAPTVSITRTDYNTFSWTSSDGVGVTGYKITTSSDTPTTWDSGNTNGSYDATSATTYYVHVKDAAGNTKSANIAAYKLTITVGTGTNLTVKGDGSSGTALANGAVVLNGTSIYATASLKSGYESLVLKDGTTTVTSPYTTTMSAAKTISTSATESTYTISYTLDGGSVATANPTSYKVTTATFTLNNPTKLGYTFVGWTGTGLSSATTTVTITKGSTGNRTYTANWEAISYTVVFNANTGSGTMANQEFKYDTAAALTANGFTKTGYSFAGWSKTLNGEKVYDDKAEVKNLATEDGAQVNLYALWSADDFIISFNSNGGTNVESISVKYDDKYSLPTEPTKRGYIFEGWAETDNATTATWKIGEKTCKGDKTWFAVWSAIQYYVEYDKNNATSTHSMANSTHKYDVLKELSPNTYERKFTVTYVYGYDGKENETVTATAAFEGWAGLPTGQIKFVDKESVINLAYINEDTVILYAKFIDAKVLLPNPTRDSHTFAGWRLDSTTIYQGNSEITPSSNITLTALWDIITFDIVYNGNGNDAGTPPEKQVKDYDKNIVISAAGTLSKVGHSFISWNTKPDGTGTTYYPGASYSANAALTLFAIWQANTYAITYLDKGGNAFSGGHESGYPTTHTYGTPTTLKSASKTGYDFKGWFLNENCTGAALTTLGARDYVNDITLYALFEAQTYNIQYLDQGGKVFSGTHASGYPTTHTYDEETVLLEASKKGYEFEGWFEDSNCAGAPITKLEATEYTSDITLFAKWNVLFYTLTLEKSEGIAEVGGAGTYAYNTTVSIFATTSLGYAWHEWQKNNTTYQTSQNFQFTIDAENVTLKALATIITYNITYELNGGSVEGVNPVTYTVKEEFTLINPTKIGYTFTGWTYEESASPIKTVKITPNTIAKDLNFVANWTPNTDTVYKINYYLENLNNSDALTTANCTLKETATLHGTTASTIQAVVKPFDGFISPTTKNVTILADGSAVVDYFYERKSFNLKLSEG